jgi:hypothetical protein
VAHVAHVVASSSRASRVLERDAWDLVEATASGLAFYYFGGCVNLPAIPSPGTAVALADVIAIEASIARQIATIQDVETLEEMRAKADALARYLQGKELHGPMLGAQRRIEARIGQLLGETSNGERHDLKTTFPRAERLSPQDRNRFRALARGFEVGLPDEFWRQSRRALLEYLQEKYPVPRAPITPHQTVDGRQKKPIAERAAEISRLAAEGRTAQEIAQAINIDESRVYQIARLENIEIKKQNKPREDRAREIASLAAEGYLGSQIADEIGIGLEQVQSIARAEGIKLPETAMGRTTGRISARRVVEETVFGIESYVDGLKMIDGATITDISVEDARAWASSLSRSVRTINRLRKGLVELTNGESKREDEPREDSGSTPGEDEGLRPGSAGAEAA